MDQYIIKTGPHNRQNHESKWSSFICILNTWNLCINQKILSLWCRKNHVHKYMYMRVLEAYIYNLHHWIVLMATTLNSFKENMMLLNSKYYHTISFYLCLFIRTRHFQLQNEVNRYTNCVGWMLHLKLMNKLSQRMKVMWACIDHKHVRLPWLENQPHFVCLGIIL